jgi:hypothetical protein
MDFVKFVTSMNRQIRYIPGNNISDIYNDLLV